MTNNFHLCTEGERLFTEWHALSDQCQDNNELVPVTNEKRREYHDHRASCPECTKVKTNER